MACRCKITMQFMRDIGAKHAAAMHLSPGATWTGKDWILHFNEEKEYLYPYLLRYFARGQVIIDQLEKEHALLLGDIALFGVIRNQSLLDAHSAYEDLLVGQLAKILKKAYAA